MRRCKLVHFAPLLLLFIPATVLISQTGRAPLPLWKDGIYRSAADFRANRPWYSWKETKGRWFYNAESGLTTIAELTTAAGMIIPIDSIAMICLNGQTALRIPADSTLRSSAIFAQLRYPGSISYFTYEGGIIDTVAIAAYNPISGKPFRQAKLPRTTREQRERIFVLETGEIRPFTADALIEAMASDPEVRRAVSLIEESDAEILRQKLLRAIEVFNQRNPVKWKNGG